MSKTLGELLESYSEQEKLTRLEGEKGFNNLCEIVKAIGYKSWNRFDTDPARDLQAFFEDNPGALEAVYEWICEQDASEWRDEVESRLDTPDEEEELDEEEEQE